VRAVGSSTTLGLQGSHTFSRSTQVIMSLPLRIPVADILEEFVCSICVRATCASVQPYHVLTSVVCFTVRLGEAVCTYRVASSKACLLLSSQSVADFSAVFLGVQHMTKCGHNFCHGCIEVPALVV